MNILITIFLTTTWLGLGVGIIGGIIDRAFPEPIYLYGGILIAMWLCAGAVLVGSILL
jgi:hypothetical protein